MEKENEGLKKNIGELNITINEHKTSKTEIEANFGNLHLELSKGFEQKEIDFQAKIKELELKITEQTEFIWRLKQDRVKRTEEITKLKAELAAKNTDSAIKTLTTQSQ